MKLSIDLETEEIMLLLDLLQDHKLKLKESSAFWEEKGDKENAIKTIDRHIAYSENIKYKIIFALNINS